VLLHDAEVSVRSALSLNPSLPKLILLQLILDESVDLRYELAENPCLPEDLLRLLVDDENPYVASRAALTLERIAECDCLARAA
jgi:hypothetical protein